MSRRAALFTEADLNRAAKVAKRLGFTLQLKPDGSMILQAAEPAPPPDEQQHEEERPPRSLL